MTLTCTRCDGTGLIDICYNNNPNREYTIRCDYCEGDAVMAVNDRECDNAAFWGERCKAYLAEAARTTHPGEVALLTIYARDCATYAATCAEIALGNADPIVRIS